MRNPKTHNERGVALILVLLSLLLVTAITMGMVLLSNSEITVNANYKDEQVALFAARAGLEEARDRMLSSNPNPITLPTILPGAGGGAYLTYITSSGSLPWSASNTYEDSEYLKEMGLSVPPTGSTWYSSTATQSRYAGPSTNPVPYRWVRINLKIDRSAYSTGTPFYVDGNSAHATQQVCYDTVNKHEVVVAAGGCTGNNTNVYAATSYAVTPGNTHRMLQYELVKKTLALNFPAAVSTVGTYTGVTPFGNQNNGFGISGVDACGMAPQELAVAGSNPTSVTNLTGQLTPAANYPGTGGTASVPSVGNDSTQMQNFQDPVNGQTVDLTTIAGLNMLVSDITSIADYVMADCSNTANLGSPSSPKVVVITGDCNISSNPSPQYAGILLVKGTLNYVDNPYQGTILAIGKGIFHQQASKLTHMLGQIFIAQTVDRTTGAALATPGTPQLDWHAGSGNPNLQYDSCTIANDSPVSGYSVLSTRELMF